MPFYVPLRSAQVSFCDVCFGSFLAQAVQVGYVSLFGGPITMVVTKRKTKKEKKRYFVFKMVILVWLCGILAGVVSFPGYYLVVMGVASLRPD